MVIFSRADRGCGGGDSKLRGKKHVTVAIMRNQHRRKKSDGQITQDGVRVLYQTKKKNEWTR